MFFLIGLPAAGKSYWGRLWAKAANLPFVDIDTAIEIAAGCTLKEIFEKEGEAGFRTQETKVLEALIAGGNPQTIVATGGGTPAFGNNLALMKKKGTVIYLEAAPALLAPRIFPQKACRPLFKNCKTEAEATLLLEEILAGRAPFYAAAHLRLPVENLSGATFEKTIRCFTVRPCS